MISAGRWRGDAVMQRPPPGAATQDGCWSRRPRCIVSQWRGDTGAAQNLSHLPAAPRHCLTFDLPLLSASKVVRRPKCSTWSPSREVSCSRGGRGHPGGGWKLLLSPARAFPSLWRASLAWVRHRPCPPQTGRDWRAAGIRRHFDDCWIQASPEPFCPP